MKRILALVLSALVLLSSMTCILLTPAAAVEQSNDAVTAYFENPANWKKGNATNNGNGPVNIMNSWTYGSITADSTVTTGTESEASVKVMIDYHCGIIDLSSLLAKNTDYTLSFRYKAEDSNKYESWNGYYLFTSIGVVSPSVAGTNGINVSLSAKTDGHIVRKCIQDNYSYYSPTGKVADIDSGVTVSRPTFSSKDAEWKDMTLQFNSGTHNDLMLIFKVNAPGNIYLDDFSLTEYTPEVIEYFEDAKNWVKEQVHASDTYGKDSVITVGAGFPTYGSILTDSEVTTGSDSKYSLKVTMAYHGASIDLSSQIEANQHYELTFKYRVTDAAQFGSWSNKPYVFQTIGVYSPTVGGADAVINHNIVDGYVVKKSIYDYSSYTSVSGKVADNVEIASNTLVDSASTDTWYQMTLQFYSGDLDDLALLFKVNAASPLYLDDFRLAEYTPPPPKEPFHSGPKEYILIDFEKEEEYIRGNCADRMEIAETTDINDKTTKALHIIGDDYSYINKDAVTILNWGYANKGKDPVFSIPVNERTTYEMRVKVRVDEAKNFMTDSLFLLYYDYWGEGVRTLEFAHTTYNKLMGEGWIEYAAEFVTDYGQETANFFLNAGVKHPDIWIDDIELIEYGRGYLDETDASYCEDFYNLAEESGYKVSGTVTKKTVFEIPAYDFEKHTLGIDLAGSGAVTLAFEQDGSDAIWSMKVGAKNKRYGINFMAGDKEGNVYLIFEPTGSGIQYSDLYLFRAKAVSFMTEMGYEENPNAVKNPTYKVKYVSATAALGGADAVGDTESPATGESLAILWILATVVLACGGLLLLTAKRKNH